jgi:uncharacterized protein YjbI with pentapeptide repeats
MTATTEEPIASDAKNRMWRGISRQELEKVLEQHRKWVESNGQEGERAELSGAHLEGMDLTGADLRGADLRKANLMGADLFLADLQRACVVQANLRGPNLLGTQLRGASLEGAILEGASGLLVGQLGGANVFQAQLPKPISEFERLKYVNRLSWNTSKILAAVLSLCVLSWLLIATTTDVQLLKDSPPLPIPHVGDALPIVELYLLAPLVLFGFYLYLLLYLQRLWEGLAELPAVFPDGQALDQTGPWLVMALSRDRFRWARRNHPARTFLEAGLSNVLVYWVVPATLVLFWARYLTRLDLRGAMLHVLVVVSTTAVALLFPHLAIRGFTADSSPLKGPATPSPNAKLYRCVALALAVGVLQCLLSVGAIYGLPHDGGRVAEVKCTDVRRWAANVLWLIGYDPYANITELDVSTKAAKWSGRDEELASISGPRLNKLRLRYARAYRTFLVNAHLWRADFRGANLSEADLRGTNFRQANLQSAVLDHARINRANLEGADLRGANLARADLRETDVSYALLSGAILIDANLAGASLYGANLGTATLLRANLEKADLREANLENANLAFADLREAQLWSATLPGAQLREAQLAHAILIEAQLRGADLRGADLQGAILRGADLTGSSLEGADLRGAVGLSAGQICSAMGRRELKLDENLRLEVDSRCGATPQSSR